MPGLVSAVFCSFRSGLPLALGVEREWLGQGHPIGFIPMARLEFGVYHFEFSASEMPSKTWYNPEVTLGCHRAYLLWKLVVVVVLKKCNCMLFPHKHIFSNACECFLNYE